MANICTISMIVVGKSEDVLKLIEERLKPLTKIEDIKEGFEYYPNLPSDIIEEELLDIITVNEENDTVYIKIDSWCKWSVESSLLESNSHVTLQELSNLYNVRFEVYGSESGCNFQEHHIIADGEVLCSECIPYYEIYYFPDFDIDKYNTLSSVDKIKNIKEELEPNIEEILNQLQLDLKDFEDALNHCIESQTDYICIGGYENWDFELIEDYLNK